jgi:phosphoketolase
MVLRTPKGWTGPKVVDGVLVEGTFRAHQVPLSNVRDNQAHMKLLEEWMRSYKPEELFDQNGTNTCGSLTCARNWNSNPWLRARLESDTYQYGIIRKNIIRSGRG